MKKVNLFEELIVERSKHISSEDLKVIIKNIWSKDDQIKKNLNEKNNDKFNELKFDKMEYKNIFHKNTIKEICVRYRLRFLDSNLFKGEYPKNITKKYDSGDRVNSQLIMSLTW